MPRVGCNGYSLFAEQMRSNLEEKLGKALPRFNDLIRAAAPYWQIITEDEKRAWKERARTYKRSDDFVSKRREARLQQWERRTRERDGSGADDSADDWDVDDDPDERDPNELPGPVVVPPDRRAHSDLFRCLPDGDFSWKTRDMTPCEVGELMQLFTPLQLPKPVTEGGGGGGATSPSATTGAAGSVFSSNFEPHGGGGVSVWLRKRQQQVQQQHEQSWIDERPRPPHAPHVTMHFRRGGRAPNGGAGGGGHPSSSGGGGQVPSSSGSRAANGHGSHHGPGGHGYPTNLPPRLRRKLLDERAASATGSTASASAERVTRSPPSRSSTATSPSTERAAASPSSAKKVQHAGDGNSSDQRGQAWTINPKMTNAKMTARGGVVSVAVLAEVPVDVFRLTDSNAVDVCRLLNRPYSPSCPQPYQ